MPCLSYQERGWDASMGASLAASLRLCARLETLWLNKAWHSMAP